jgi:hypothetical protein
MCVMASLCRISHDTWISHREAVRLAPTNGYELATLAWFMVDARSFVSNRIEEAEFLSGRAVQLSPDDPDVWPCGASF